MSPLNRGPMMAPRGPTGMRPPMPPRFERVPPPFPPVMGRGLPPRGSPMFGPVRNRPLPPPPPPRPGPMMSRQVGPPVPPMFGPPRSRPLPQIPPMPPMGMRGPMGPMRSIMRPGPRGVLPPHALPHMRPRFPPNHIVTKGKMNNTKKNNKLEELELKKPWMTDEIRTEIQKKNKLYAKAKKNKGAKEWEEFKDLRNKVTRMIRDAKNEYLAKNPEKAHLYENDNALEDVDNDDNIDECFSDSEEEQSNPYCEVCDRDFYSEELLEAHIQEHQTCNIDGCQFKAHAKIVEKHISMQHSTGLYQRMKHVTSEEDIDKWIAERKRRYPTAANVKIQEVEQLEKQKRGEIIKLDQHASGSSKKEQIKKNRKRKRNKRFHMKVTEEEKIVQGEVYRGLLPFAGTAMLEKEERPDDNLVEKTSVNENSEQQFEVSDEDEEVIEQPTTNKSKIDEVQKSQIGIPKTLGLVADYGSDSEYDDPPDEVPVKVLKLDLKEEHQSDKLESQFKVEEPESNIKETLLTSVDNKANIKNEKKFKVKKIPNKTSKSNNAKFSNERLRLLNKLLARSMQHERNIICQCITFIANNNFLEC